MHVAAPTSWASPPNISLGSRSLRSLYRACYPLPAPDVLCRLRVLFLHRLVKLLKSSQSDRGKLTSPTGCRFFAFWGGETAAWSLGVSYIVHRRATSAKPHTWQVHAANILGPLVPSVYTVVLLVLAIPGGRHYAQAIDVARQVENELLQRAASWREGQPFSVLSLAWAMPLLQKEAAFFTDFLESFRAVYTFYAVSAAVLVAVRTLEFHFNASECPADDAPPLSHWSASPASTFRPSEPA